MAVWIIVFLLFCPVLSAQDQDGLSWQREAIELSRVQDLVMVCGQDEQVAISDEGQTGAFARMALVACGSFIRGVLDLYQTLEMAHPETLLSLCLPDHWSLSQLSKIFVKHMEESPEVLHETAPAMWFMIAIMNAFPCEDHP